MAQNYSTDLDHLNKLYRINKKYNSPIIISNYPEIKKQNKIILEKLSPYTYFPTYVKLLKKNNLYSPPITDKKMKTIYNQSPNKYNSFIISENKLSPLRPRIQSNSTDFVTKAGNRRNPYNLNKINKLRFSGSADGPKYKDLKNNKIIIISPPQKNINDRYSNKIKGTKNLKMNNIYVRNKNKTYNNYNNNSISFYTDINKYREPKLKRNFPYNSPYKEFKKNIRNDNIFINNNIFYSDTKIQLDDLIFLEERFNSIIIALNNIQNNFNINIINECEEFFNFYFNSSLNNKFVYFFSEQNHIIIHTAFNLILFLIIIAYHLSLNPSMLEKSILILQKTFEALKVNLYLFIRKIELYYGDSFCGKNEIYFNKFNYYLIKNGIYDLSESEIIDIISRNSVHSVNDIRIILNYYKSINNKYYFDFQNIYLSLSKMTENDFNTYFYNNILNSYEENLNNNNINYYYYDIENSNDANIYTNYNNYDNSYDNNYDNNNYDNNFIIENIVEEDEDENEDYLDNIILYYKLNKANPPFLKPKNTKKYTLVVDLGGTLINIKINNNGQAFCHMRPGIISFLLGIKPYYEIIAYTKLSKEYSELIIQHIENNRKIFDYNLYREHCVLIGNRFVKDISRIGRDMKKIIMVDDVPENLERYHENGILILPYNGVEDNEEDRVLFELKKLLILFYKIGYEDLRNAIKSYKKEIFDKITMGNID